MPHYTCPLGQAAPDVRVCILKLEGHNDPRGSRVGGGAVQLVEMRAGWGVRVVEA